MTINAKMPFIPLRIRPGDTIGIAAPASPFDRKKFERGLAALESMGFVAFVPHDLYNRNGYLAGTDVHRATLMNRLFADHHIKAVMCARGGYGSLRMLSLLDWDLIRRHPKIFVGYSDISAILSVLLTKCGLTAFHGPTVVDLADATPQTKAALFAAFSYDMPIEISAPRGVEIRSGSASGPVSGGNLTTLCHLIGTSFQPCFKGHILLLEERGESSYRVDRMLTQMRLAGCFRDLAGLILGSFEDCGAMREIYRIVDDIFRDLHVPILAGFEVGHGRTNISIPFGMAATLDTVGMRLSFHALATRE